MSDRITDSMLNARVKRLNELTQSPAEPYSRIDGKNVANIGNFHLSHAYGGVCLHRMYNDGGGVTTRLSATTQTSVTCTTLSMLTWTVSCLHLKT
jgi:uncharacterized membrane protein YqiK